MPSKTVYENVAFAMQVVETNPKYIRRNVPQILSMVGLGKKAKAYPNQLSGGEQQRVALARAIINRPPILLQMNLLVTLTQTLLGILWNLFRK